MVPVKLMLGVTLQWHSIPSREKQKFSLLFYDKQTGISCLGLIGNCSNANLTQALDLDWNTVYTLLLLIGDDVFCLTGRYWNNVKRAATQICQSLVQAQQREKEEADTVTALASLSMGVVQESDK